MRQKEYVNSLGTLTHHEFVSMHTHTQVPTVGDAVLNGGSYLPLVSRLNPHGTGKVKQQRYICEV